MFLDYLKLLMRKDKMNAFVCFKMSSLNQPCKGFASQEHNTPTEQQFQGEKKYHFSHFVLADVSILLQWQLLIAK